MDYIIQVKEEPVDKSFEAVHVGTKVLDKEETAVSLDIQNGFNDINGDIPGKQDGIIKTEYPAVKVKAEPQSSGEKRVIEELVTPNGSRKRKSSSTLLKILNPDRQIDEPSNNDCGSLPLSKKPQPTLANLLHGFNVSAMQHSIPVDTIDDDVQITHITSPTVFKKGSCSKPTLQKMLTSPYSGKSPLLSSMLKTPKNHSTPSGSRTNSTIDKVFTFSVRPIVDNKSLSEMLGNQNSNQTRRVDGALTMNKNANVKFNGSPTKLTGNHSESALSKTLSTSSCNSGMNENNLLKIPSNFITKVDLSGRGNIDGETSRPSVNNDDLEKSVSLMKNIPKELQNDNLINMWTNIITQKVISEFSKDVNATLNSFVKKAIMDSITTSSLATGETGPQKTDSTNVQQMAGLSQVSSLTSSLLSSLAEKVSGCSIPAKVPDNLTESKPPAVRTHNVFTEKNIVKNSNIDQNIDKNAWKNSKLFGKFTTVPSTRPYTVTKFEGMVKKPHVNVTASTSNQTQTIITSTTKMTSSQKDSNKITIAPTQMVLQPVKGEDGKFLVYSCNLCGKRFQHHGTLSVHQRTHILESGKSDFKCDICGKVCTAKRYLDIHMRTHLKGQRELVGPKVSCTICGKEFSSEENLIIHKRMHLGEKLYQCDVCHTGFTRNSQLVIHMRIHSGEKPYICNVCGKSFRQSNGLSLHLNVHTDDKPYKCEICGSGFSRKAHYEKHMRKERGERPFKCSECGKGFTDKFNLTMHTRIHQKDKAHVCEICGKGFVQNTHLRNHMKFHSGEKGFSCSHCPERFEMRKFLQNHLIIAHQEKEDSLTTNRIKRIANKSFKGQYNDTDEDDISWDGDSLYSNGSDDGELGAGYSDMIMHISQEFDDSQNEEFGRINQKYAEGFIDDSILSHDVSDVKVEPIEFDLSTDSLKSQLHDNALLDFDPMIVKDEPEDCLDENGSQSFDEHEPDLELVDTHIKEEPCEM